MYAAAARCGIAPRGKSPEGLTRLIAGENPPIISSVSPFGMLVKAVTKKDGSSAQKIDHPLRRARNLLLTPHVAGNMTLGYTCDKSVQMFCDDLENYAAGRPLAHLVDRKRGY